MRIVNRHARSYPASPEAVGALLDSLASAQDRLWPRDSWPPMVLDGGLVVGARGGHGPVRYVVEAYEPGVRVAFRFTSPRGWSGTHAFIVEPSADGRTALVHLLEMHASGSGLLAWAVVFRPLHDALIEDALDRAATALGDPPARHARWSGYVRLLRRLLRRRSRDRARSGRAEADGGSRAEADGGAGRAPAPRAGQHG